MVWFMMTFGAKGNCSDVLCVALLIQEHKMLEVTMVAKHMEPSIEIETK